MRARPVSADLEADRASAVSRAGWLSHEAFLIIALSTLLVVLNTLAYFGGRHPFRGVWDDSLMLTRYAHNVFAFGRIAWNPGGQPTYGITSPYYFVCIVLPVAKFVTSNLLAIPMVSSIISGAVFLLALAFVLRWCLPGLVLFRYLFLALTAVLLARNAYDISVHLVSGMDTCFAMLYLTLFIALQRWHALRLTAASAVLAGIWGGLAFGARPDLLVFSMLVPVGWIVLGASRREKALGLGMLLTVAVVLAMQIAFAATYFDSPLPLPFYAKSLRLYPGLSGYRFTGLVHFVEFSISYGLLYFLIIVDITWDARGWWRETSPFAKSLTAGLLIYWTYFLFGVTQIMPDSHRFYYPALPVVVYLAGCATVRLLGRIPGDWIASIGGWPKRYHYAVFAATILLVPLPFQSERSSLNALAHGQVVSFDLGQAFQAYTANYWFGLDRFSALPLEGGIATTETGLSGAMNLDKPIFDLAGLNDTLFAHHRFSADVFFNHYHPDLIYMPLPAYSAMRASLIDNPTFQRDYEWMKPEDLGNVRMGVALSRTSRQYDAMRQVVKSVCTSPPAGPCKLNSL